MGAFTKNRLVLKVDQCVKWHPKVRVEKFDDEQTAWVAKRSGIVAPRGDDFAALGVKPLDIALDEGNLLTTAGLTRLTALLTATGSTQAITNTSARIGVGNSTTAANVADTDLGAAAGSSNRYFQPMDATYPTVSGGVVTLKATFGTSDGNFAWDEWGIDVGTPTVAGGTTVAALLFNHKIASLGTKSSGSWAFTVTVTFS